MSNRLPFSTETSNFVETVTIGGFNNANTHNSFDTVFENTMDVMAGSVNTLLDINALLKNPHMMEQYKEELLGQLKDDSSAIADRMSDGVVNDAYFGPATLYEQVSQLWDNTVDDLIKESTSIGNLIPIKTMDLPLLIKQQVKITSKDIMQTEVTTSPIIKKHMEQTYITGKVPDGSGGIKRKEWRYPQCFFNGEYNEIFEAGKGIKIPSETPVTLPLMNWDLIKNLVPTAQVGRDRFTMDLQIVAVDMIKAEGGTDVEKVILVRPMRINLSDGSWLGGKISVGDGSGTVKAKFDDLIVGHASVGDGTISLSACNGKVTKVYFNGYLSNEYNERQVSFTYKREELEWKIEDGARFSAPYSIEELEDAKALLNIDLYKKTYENIADSLAQIEDSKNFNFLDTEFDKYKGLELDPLGFNSFIREQVFNAKNETSTGVLQSEYIEKMLKWQLDRFINDIADSAKVEDMTFVIYGNPRWISLLGSAVKWVVNSGDMVGGIKANYSYGIMTTGNFKVQVVSTNKMVVGNPMHNGIRVIPYPLNKEMMTFKHYKYSTHIMTSANSGYKDPDRAGGSKTYIMGVSRYTNAAVQGLQGHLSFTNDQFILKK